MSPFTTLLKKLPNYKQNLLGEKGKWGQWWEITSGIHGSHMDSQTYYFNQNKKRTKKDSNSSLSCSMIPFSYHKNILLF